MNENPRYGRLESLRYIEGGEFPTIRRGRI